MALVWVTGNSGAGKSTVCALLEGLGEQAVDADNEGYCHWADRSTGLPVAEWPDPVPAGWLDRFGWKISRGKVQALAAGSHDRVAFLCGSVENEAEVRDLFDLIVCIVVDEQTLTDRLATRTTNDFGKHPEELAAALYWNPRQERRYRRLGATIVDGRNAAPEVAAAVRAAARSFRERGQRQQLREQLRAHAAEGIPSSILRTDSSGQ